MDSVKFITKNRRARYDYTILETCEAGIVLRGSEVKSLREGKVSLIGCYARVDQGEVFLFGLHIPPYETGRTEPESRSTKHEGLSFGSRGRPFRIPPKFFGKPDPARPRKLLLHKMEIRRLIGMTQERGITLIPLSLYFKRGIAKLELGLCKGKRKVDKRHIIRQRDLEREMGRR